MQCTKLFWQVNGVAELHSNILKEELFADYLSIWPNKFQNKTNGITPRRWLRFCNPELSEIVTKWLKTDQWTSNLDLLTGLRKVCVHASNLAFMLLPITQSQYNWEFLTVRRWWKTSRWVGSSQVGQQEAPSQACVGCDRCYNWPKQPFRYTN
jgi:hypothetical protein